MESNFLTFKNDVFGEIRTMTNEKGETFFVGKDVAKALGYSDARKAIRVHVDSDDRGVDEMATPGGIQKVVIINESGLYSLILSSRTPAGIDYLDMAVRKLPREMSANVQLYFNF